MIRRSAEWERPSSTKRELGCDLLERRPLRNRHDLRQGLAGIGRDRSVGPSSHLIADDTRHQEGQEDDQQDQSSVHRRIGFAYPLGAPPFHEPLSSIGQSSTKGASSVVDESVRETLLVRPAR